MDANLTKLGGSLPVPSVQELAKEPITKVLPRYVRADQDHPFMHDDLGTSLLQLPVIDLTKFSASNDDLMESELEKLHVACRDWGSFQLINHGVSCSMVEEVKLGVQEFLKLPMEEKRKFWQEEGDLEGFGQSFVVPDEQKLDCSDIFFMVSFPRHLRKPRLFPMLPSPFRMNYYPPCPRPELVIGLTPHSDASALTILLHVNEMEGLQIKKEGKWIPVKLHPNAFVVNVGDILEIVMNGTYRSIEHRATVNSVKERLSFAAFYGPKLDGKMGPASSLITLDKPTLFRNIGIADFFKGRFSRELRGRSYLDIMRNIQGEKRGLNLAIEKAN